MSRLALLIAAISAALALAGPATAHVRAHITLAHSEPPMVRGAGFHRHEKVRVVVRQNWGAKLVGRAQATSAGRFTVEFPGATPPCGNYRVTASGSMGSRAALAGMKLPACVIR